MSPATPLWRIDLAEGKLPPLASLCKQISGELSVLALALTEAIRHPITALTCSEARLPKIIQQKQSRGRIGILLTLPRIVLEESFDIIGSTAT